MLAKRQRNHLQQRNRDDLDELEQPHGGDR